jgi:hypothetical protein
VTRAGVERAKSRAASKREEFHPPFFLLGESQAQRRTSLVPAATAVYVTGEQIAYVVSY